MRGQLSGTTSRISEKRQLEWKRGFRIIAGSAVAELLVDGMGDGLQEIAQHAAVRHYDEVRKVGRA